MATLYRKYRPQTFDQIIGQEHVVKTLKNAFKTGRISHAYLFTGPRGVGKTTMARLMAKALNCLDEKNKPCGDCDNCKAIASGNFIDLIEIDAASNRGIDEIRELRDKIRFAPSIGLNKVYIIDEVHMLTKEAFNALLKTLEEPPEHTVFIFATTEAHKLPQTVLSRCQQFDFTLASEDFIRKSLQKIVKEEGFKINDDVLELVVSGAAGSFRDAQSLLDQISSFLVEGELSLDEASKILQLTSLQEVEEFLKILQEKDLSKSLNFIDNLSQRGVNLEQFMASLIIQARLKLIENLEDQNLAAWYLKLIKKVNESSQVMAKAPVETLALEVLSLEICQNLEQIKVVEQVSKTETTTTKEDKKEKAEEAKIPEKPKKNLSSDKKVAIIETVNEKKKTLGTMLAGAQCFLEGKCLNIQVEYPFHKDTIMRKDNIKIIEQIAKEIVGDDVEVICSVVKDEDLAKDINSVFEAS